jgi:hypothetical protein
MLPTTSRIEAVACVVAPTVIDDVDNNTPTLSTVTVIVGASDDPPQLGVSASSSSKTVSDMFRKRREACIFP